MLEDTKVVSLSALNETTYSLVLRAPKIAAAARAGQLAHVSCPGFLLRRPFGICDADQKEGTIRICFEVRGDGTEALTKVKVGDTVSVNGAVGYGFEKIADRRVLFVGGGIGIFPLLYAAKFAKEATAALCFRDRSRVVMAEDFAKVCKEIFLATDDGSLGYHGYAAGLVKDLLKDHEYDAICVCGPKIMMKTVSEVAAEAGIDCYVSLEERMGCGVGACLACVCQTMLGQKRVCIDGPVFDAKEVRWDA